MRYEIDMDIEVPRPRVVALFDNADNMKEWQPCLVSFEPMSGTPGEVGAESRLRYKMGKRDIEMVETITENALPDTFAGTYEAKGVWNEVRNRFIEVDENTTRWHMETEFKFTTLPMKIMGTLMPGAFKKQSRQFMEQFKAFAEKRHQAG